MPRTKQTRKNTSGVDESELFVKDFEKTSQGKIRKIENTYNMRMENLMSKIDVALSLIPKEMRTNISLNELLQFQLDKLNENDEKNVTSTSDDVHVQNPKLKTKNKKLSQRQTAASTDDGYVTESGTQQKNRHHVSRIDASKTVSKRLPERQTKRSSSSSTRDSRLRSSSDHRVTSKTIGKKERSNSQTKDNLRPRTRSSSSNNRTTYTQVNNKMVTPAVSRQGTEYNLVTPKIKPNTPMNVLRRPREGEMALSMQGSPLLISAIVPDKTANINVPLNNGNVISLLPNDGLRLSHIPKLDEETMKQLKTLKGHIEQVIGKY